MPSVRRVVLWQRAVGAAKVPVTQASGRTDGLRGQSAYERSLHAGRPDNLNVWHGVPGDKTLRANNFSQLSSRGHA